MPNRTCIGCGTIDERTHLVRLAIDAAGRVQVDRAGRRPGRGAWLHKTRACADEAAHNGRFPRAFKRRTQPVEGDRLWAELTFEN